MLVVPPRARRLLGVLTATVLLLSGAAVLAAAPASATGPAGMPAVTDGEVLAFARMGSRVVVGGNFTTVRLPDGTTVGQPRLFAYDFGTGTFDAGFRPVVNREVNALVGTADGTAVFVGGSFTSVNGLARQRLAKVRADGSTDTAFVANANKRVQALSLRGNRLFVGGQFTKIKGKARSLLAELNATTGRVAAGFTVGISGTAGSGGYTGVAALELSPTADRLLLAHTGRYVGGQERFALAVIDVSGTTASVTPWVTTLWSDRLAEIGGTVRVTDAQWGPDGTWFVVTNTGGDRPPTNDCVQRFDLGAALPAEPTWVTRQFDSGYAVDVAPDGTVYTGGHFQFTEAPGSVEPYPGGPDVNYGTGIDTYGARVLGDQVVHREQVNALDPTTGKAVNWWSSADGQRGVLALKVTEGKLLVGHDGQRVDGQALGRHGMAELYPGAVDASRPRSVVTSPLIGANLTVGSLVVAGTSTTQEGAAITKVQVEVKRSDAASWLRADSTWGSYYAFRATLDSAGAPSTTWSLSVPMDGLGDYDVLVRSFDSAGRQEPVKVRVPILVSDPSNTPPVVSWATPTSGQSSFTSNTITVRGGSSDADGVDSVVLSFRNTTEGLWLAEDGVLGEYAAFPATLADPGAVSTTWSLTVTLPDGEYTASAAATDRLGATDPRSSRKFTMAPGNAAPTTTMGTPAANEVVGSTFTITGTATDDTAVAKVFVRVADQRLGLGPQIGGTIGSAAFLPATLATPGAPSTDWSLTVTGIPSGLYTVTAYAEDDLGIQATGSARPSRTVRCWPAGATAEPATSITSPLSDTRFADRTLTVTGSASYPPGVTGVQLVVRSSKTSRYLQPDGSSSPLPGYLPAVLASPGATATTWTGVVTLPADDTWRVDAIAVGADGNVDATSSGSRLAYQVYPGDADPSIELNSPTDGAVVAGTGGEVYVNGRAFDDHGVASVQVLVRNVAGTQGARADGSVGAPQWVTVFVTNPGGVFTNYNYVSPALPYGTWRVSARAVDSVGKVQLTYPTVTVTTQP